MRELHGLTALHLAAAGAELAGEQSQQRRLARAVGADERDAVTGTQAPGDAVDDPGSAVGVADVLGLDHLVAEPRAREAQQLGAVARGWLVGDQRVGRLDPELRLRGPGRRPAAQPRELLAHQLLAALLARGLDAVALGAREHVGRVAALVLVHRRVDDLPGVRADRVEEPAVVGDDQHRAVARGQMAGQPGDRLDVEVVGRLVEQQQVGVVEQHPRERDPPPLAAREPLQRRVDPGAEALERDATEQAVEHSAELATAGPFVLGAFTHEHLADRRPGGQTVALVERIQAQPAEPGHLAAVRTLGAGDQFEQRRLTLAVAADHADAVAVGDPERDAVEDRPRGVLLADRAEVHEIAGAGAHRP